MNSQPKFKVGQKVRYNGGKATITQIYINRDGSHDYGISYENFTGSKVTYLRVSEWQLS